MSRNLESRLIINNIDYNKDMRKKCTKCLIEKDTLDFYPDRRKYRKTGSTRPDCKICSAKMTRAYALKNPEMTAKKLRNWRLSHYGLNLESFNEILIKQGGVCAVCRGKNKTGFNNQLHIDHDHSCCDSKDSCGKCIRGLLCFKCNTALGMVGDSYEKLELLIKYLKKWKK